MAEPFYTMIVSIDAMRLDRYIALAIPEKSRTMIQSWIESGCVFYNRRLETSPSFKVRSHALLEIYPPAVKESHLIAQDIPLNIVYEDEDLLVINKPAGLVVHPAPGNPDGTLVNALLKHCTLSEIGGVQRPGIVHRLDKDTSGLMVVAKNDKAHHALSEQFQGHKTLKRVYHVWVWTKVNPGQGLIDAPIGRHPKNRQRMAIVRNGKAAKSHYICESFWQLTRDHGIARLRIQLETGRTHQIRVHCLYKGWPVIGDPVYGSPGKGPEFIKFFSRQALHASELSFFHKEESMKFQSPWPADLMDLQKAIAETTQPEPSKYFPKT